MPRRYVHTDGRVALEFTATETWTVPSGVTRLQVEAWGAGGAGGANGLAAGGGGGGGAYARNPDVSVTPGTVLTVTVAASQNTGDGLGSGIAGIVVAAGGKGGAAGSTTAGAGGAGGTVAASVGTVRYAGGAGATAGGGAGGAGGAGGNASGLVFGPGGNSDPANSAEETGGGGGGEGGQRDVNGAYPGGGGGGQGVVPPSSRGAGGTGLVVIAFVEAGNETSNATHGQSAAIADNGTQATNATHTPGLEAVGDTGTGEATATHASGMEALGDTGVGLASSAHAGPWRITSPGLTDRALTADGTQPVPGAEVLVFRDDTHALQAETVTDAEGDWTAELNPSHTYWVAYHEGAPGSPGVRGWRTDKGLVTSDTTVAEGASGP